MAVKVLFAFYPLFVKYNHGIALLSSLCKDRGIETELYILDDVPSFEKHLLKSQPDYVAFSCVVDADYRLSLPFMKNAQHCGLPVLLGGVYPRRKACVEAPANFICHGEGESLPDFLLNGDRSMFMEKKVCPDIGSLPLPDYELFKDIPFDRGTPFLDGLKVLPYYSSRGCSFKCSFCEVKGQPKVVRLKYQVGKDLEYLSEKYHPDIFFIGDELLPYYNEKWRASWEGFKHPFVAYIRADVPEDILRWLHVKGMVGCAFGIESGDEQYRNEVLNKNLKNEDIRRTVSILKELKIQYAAFYMTNTPHETFSIKAKTFRMADEIGGYPYIWEYENLFEEVF